MIVAVVGSRTLKVENLKDYLPKNTAEIVSGGAKGIDTCAKKYALENNIKYTEFLPEYEKYGRSAPLKVCRLCNCILGRKIKRNCFYYWYVQKL